MSVFCFNHLSNVSLSVCVCLKDGVCSSDQLRQFGVGEDSVVGVNFQTDSQDHRRGRLQGLTPTHKHGTITH